MYMLHLIFFFQLIFVFLLFLGMVMYANELETKEKQKLPATCMHTKCSGIHFLTYKQGYLTFNTKDTSFSLSIQANKWARVKYSMEVTLPLKSITFPKE